MNTAATARSAVADLMAGELTGNGRVELVAVSGAQRGGDVGDGQRLPLSLALAGAFFITPPP